MKLNIITLAVVLIVAIVYSAHAADLAWTPAHIAGASIVVPAFLLFVLARLQLGSAFSVEAKATRLVATGLYARIRNPIYVFGALMILGGIVFVGRPRWLLIFVVLIPLQVWRSRKEEKLLEGKFGEEYRAYKRRTWF